MLRGRDRLFGNNLSSRGTGYLWLGSVMSKETGQCFQTEFDLWLFPSCQVSQHGQPPLTSSSGLNWYPEENCQCHFLSFCPSCRYHDLLLGLTASDFPSRFGFQEPLCGISVAWSGSCCLLLLLGVVFVEGKCFGGEGTMKSSSCPPSCQKLRHALVMLPCHQTANGILFFILHVWLCWHTSVHIRKKLMSLGSVWDWHAYSLPFPQERWKSLKKLIAPLNFKSLQIAPLIEFNIFLNVNSGKYLLFKHECPSDFSHHWKCITLFSPLNFEDHSS